MYYTSIGMVNRLHEGKCSVVIGSQLLIYCSVIRIEQELECAWRMEGVKIIVGVSSGIMHIRKKTVERCEVEYEVAEEVIPMVSSYI